MDNEHFLQIENTFRLAPDKDEALMVVRNIYDELLDSIDFLDAGSTGEARALLQNLSISMRYILSSYNFQHCPQSNEFNQTSH